MNVHVHTRILRVTVLPLDVVLLVEVSEVEELGEYHQIQRKAQATVHNPRQLGGQEVPLRRSD